MDALIIHGNRDNSPSVVNNARSRQTNTSDWRNDLNAGAVSMSLQRLQPSPLVKHIVIAIGDIWCLNEISSDISSLIRNELPFTSLMMEWSNS